MKKYILLLIVIVVIGCSNTFDFDNITIDYNVEKTKMIDSILSTYPKVWKKNAVDAEFFYIQTASIKIEISHYFPVPFKQKEEWNVDAININGEKVLLDRSYLSPEHRISKNVYDKIIQYVINNEK